MIRISYNNNGRTTEAIFAELRETFSRDDYSAATTDLDRYDIPGTVIILTNTRAVETFLRLKFDGITDFKFDIRGEYDTTK
jgi:hypothetical protein